MASEYQSFYTPQYFYGVKPYFTPEQSLFLCTTFVGTFAIKARKLAVTQIQWDRLSYLIHDCQLILNGLQTVFERPFTTGILHMHQALEGLGALNEDYMEILAHHPAPTKQAILRIIRIFRYGVKIHTGECFICRKGPTALAA